jgi:formylglycine-generating enzyme required for sulfatase activity
MATSIGTWDTRVFDQADDHPVVNVSWNDAVAFCKWLGARERANYRLPTEAEWEYACRAGTTTRFNCGDDPEKLVEVGNVADAAFRERLCKYDVTIRANDGYVYTAPVGRFRPNAFGLYDMHGNARQWCSDLYDVKYYQTSPTDDPVGPATARPRPLPPIPRNVSPQGPVVFIDAVTGRPLRLRFACGATHVCRGSSWCCGPDEALSAARAGAPADATFNDCGFRVARDR